MNEINGKSAVIVGYGREGQSTHRYLMSRYPKLKIGIADGCEIEPIDPSVNLHIGSDYLDYLDVYDVIVRSPGISPNLAQIKKYKKQGKTITSAMNIFFSLYFRQIIGITGTKGKSTTSSLIADILKTTYRDVRLVGNIGKPVLDYIDGVNSQTIFVAELSSQQLWDLKYSPHVAVLLAIYPEHLDTHKTFGAYLKAKSNIVNYQSNKGFVIYNSANLSSKEIAQVSSAKKVPFSTNPKKNTFCYVKREEIVLRDNGRETYVLNKTDIPLLGPGNIENVLAAVCVASIFKVPTAKIKGAVKKFKSLPHRLEFVASVKGIKFYNDSQATNPMAVINALEALTPNVETLIVGGFDRGLDLTKMANFIAKTNVKNLILLPTTGSKIWSIVSQAKYPKNLLKKFVANSMEEAVKYAFSNTKKGKICLLSPGAASFGLFRNYEERGNLFKKIVLLQKVT